MKSIFSVIVLSLLFSSASLGQDFVAQVKLQEKGQWGYVNAKGDLIVSPMFKRCHKFSEDGLAPIYKDKKFFFINTKGDQLSTEVSDYRLFEGGFGIGLQGFSNGLVAVRVGKKWGYLNTDGKIAIDIKYDKATQFDNGFAMVKKGKNFYVISANGEENKVEHPEVYDVKYFTEGLAPFFKKDKSHGFIGTDGKIAIPAEFANVGYFHGGYAWAKTKDKKVGFINTKGEWVVKPRFLAAKNVDLVSGLARIKNENGWAYVNMQGEVLNVVTETYGDFKNGLAHGKKDGKIGYFNAKGEWVIEPKFEVGRKFKNGYAAVRVDRKWGFINLEGEWVIEPKFAAVKDMEMVK